MKAGEAETSTNTWDTYRAGFHKYATEEAAKGSWLIHGSCRPRFACRVELIGVHTIGSENTTDEVLVADGMLVRRADLAKALKEAGLAVPEKKEGKKCV